MDAFSTPSCKWTSWEVKWVGGSHTERSVGKLTRIGYQAGASSPPDTMKTARKETPDRNDFWAQNWWKEKGDQDFNDCRSFLLRWCFQGWLCFHFYARSFFYNKRDAICICHIMVKLKPQIGHQDKSWASKGNFLWQQWVILGSYSGVLYIYYYSSAVCCTFNSNIYNKCMSLYIHAYILS